MRHTTTACAGFHPGPRTLTTPGHRDSVRLQIFSYMYPPSPVWVRPHVYIQPSTRGITVATPVYACRQAALVAVITCHYPAIYNSFCHMSGPPQAATSTVCVGATRQYSIVQIRSSPSLLYQYELEYMIRSCLSIISPALPISADHHDPRSRHHPGCDTAARAAQSTAFEI